MKRTDKSPTAPMRRQNLASSHSSADENDRSYTLHVGASNIKGKVSKISRRIIDSENVECLIDVTGMTHPPGSSSTTVTFPFSCTPTGPSPDCPGITDFYEMLVNAFTADVSVDVFWTTDSGATGMDERICITQLELLR